LTAYLAANGIVLPIAGFLTRLIGRKRYFLICIAMFTLSSFLCATATSLPQLIVFRLMQGFFGGGLQPSQQAIILDTFPSSKRAQAFAITAMAIVVAPVLGPTLGGWITDNYSWRWIFLINVPIGILTMVAVAKLVEDPPSLGNERNKPTMDYIGLALISLTLGSFQVMLDTGEDADWFQSPSICVLAGLSALGLMGAISWLLCAKKPIVNLRVFADRNFSLGCAAMAAMSFILYSSAVLTPAFAEQNLGYTATLAGLILTPGAVALIILIVVVGKIMPLVQTRYIIAFGFMVLGGAFYYSSGIAPDIDFGTLVKMRILQTVGLGFLFVPISTITYVSLPSKLNGDAGALFTMFRNVAGSAGISIATAMVTTRSQVRMAYLSPSLTPFSEPYKQTLSAITQSLKQTGTPAVVASQSAVGMLYQQLLSQARLLAYVDVFMMCAVAAILVVPLAFFFSSSKAESGNAPVH
jgi:DHA2 family multidrug resistance protein